MRFVILNRSSFTSNKRTPCLIWKEQALILSRVPRTHTFLVRTLQDSPLCGELFTSLSSTQALYDQITAQGPLGVDTRRRDFGRPGSGCRTEDQRSHSGTSLITRLSPPSPRAFDFFSPSKYTPRVPDHLDVRCLIAKGVTVHSIRCGPRRSLLPSDHIDNTRSMRFRCLTAGTLQPAAQASVCMLRHRLQDPILLLGYAST